MIKSKIVDFDYCSVLFSVSALIIYVTVINVNKQNKTFILFETLLLTVTRF